MSLLEELQRLVSDDAARDEFIARGVPCRLPHPDNVEEGVLYRDFLNKASKRDHQSLLELHSLGLLPTVQRCEVRFSDGIPGRLMWTELTIVHSGIRRYNDSFKLDVEDPRDFAAVQDFMRKHPQVATDNMIVHAESLEFFLELLGATRRTPGDRAIIYVRWLERHYARFGIDLVDRYWPGRFHPAKANVPAAALAAPHLFHGRVSGIQAYLRYDRQWYDVMMKGPQIEYHTQVKTADTREFFQWHMLLHLLAIGDAVAESGNPPATKLAAVLEGLTADTTDLIAAAIMDCAPIDNYREPADWRDDYLWFEWIEDKPYEMTVREQEAYETATKAREHAADAPF